MPLARQSYLLHFPIGPRSRPEGSPASCQQCQWLLHAVVGRGNSLVELAHLIQGQRSASHARMSQPISILTKSLELFAPWPLCIPSIVAATQLRTIARAQPKLIPDQCRVRSRTIAGAGAALPYHAMRAAFRLGCSEYALGGCCYGSLHGRRAEGRSSGDSNRDAAKLALGKVVEGRQTLAIGGAAK